MSHFDKAIKYILEHEGSYTDNPADPGGPTKFGICQKQYPDLDIRNLTVEQAMEIYRRDYWRPYMDQMPFDVACKLFDMSVNMGHGTANKLLQRALWVEVDGDIGPVTLSAINSGRDVAEKLAVEQENFYRSLADRRPSSRVFLKGWLRRASWLPPQEAIA